jgi:TPR repeat protein
MPMTLICCISLPPATISSLPIYDFAEANEELANEAMESYHACCRKIICRGCIYSFCESGNNKCPFCNSDRNNKTNRDIGEEMMRRVEANDATSICMLASHYYQGTNSIQQDQRRAIELFTKSAEHGCSKAHSHLGDIYYKGGDLKKAKFHVEAAAMAGHEGARYNLGIMEKQSGNMERAIKHLTISASAGCYRSIQHLKICFEKGVVSRESIDSILEAYNNSCAGMRSEARDARIHVMIETI